MSAAELWCLLLSMIPEIIEIILNIILLHRRLQMHLPLHNIIVEKMKLLFCFSYPVSVGYSSLNITFQSFVPPQQSCVTGLSLAEADKMS